MLSLQGPQMERCQNEPNLAPIPEMYEYNKNTATNIDQILDTSLKACMYKAAFTPDLAL